MLFGDYNPAGRLPVTFYRSDDDLPEFTDYSMTGRTYRYFKGEPLYPFGYGLSYTSFAYDSLVSDDAVASDGTLEVTVGVTNTGDRAGDEVVQLYVSRTDRSKVSPLRSLKGFRRVNLAPGERREVKFRLSPRDMSEFVDSMGVAVMPGEMVIYAGGGQPGSGVSGISKKVNIVGDVNLLPY